MSIGADVHLRDIPEDERKPSFCPCESAYCTQHGGDLNHDFGDARGPWCDACLNVPEGNFTMDFLGIVCDQCATVNANICHRVITAPLAPGIERIVDRIDQAYAEWDNGEQFSPSSSDLVRYGAEVTGIASLNQEIIDTIGDEVYAAQCNSAGVVAIASILHTRLSEAVIERRA